MHNFDKGKVMGKNKVWSMLCVRGGVAGDGNTAGGRVTVGPTQERQDSK